MNAICVAGGKVVSRHGQAWRERGAPLFLSILLLAASVLLSPSLALGDFISNTATASGYYGDDFHTSTLNPDPLIPVSSITYAGNPALNGQCAWINAGLAAFVTANPADGSGPSGQAWTFTWAGVAQEASLEKGITLVGYNSNGTNYSGYNPYVVNRPAVTGAPGSAPTPGNPNGARVFPASGPGEFGGAVINLQYTPQAGAPAITNLHWIQALTGTLWGHAVAPLLDSGKAYSSQSTVSPWYLGTGYSAGTLAGGGGFFEDRPLVPEFDSYFSHKEYESNPVASIQFQVVLASDTTTVVDGVTQNNVTLYGGEWWGFTYSAVETPEPASLTLLGIGAFGLFGYGWRQRKRSTV